MLFRFKAGCAGPKPILLAVPAQAVRKTPGIFPFTGENPIIINAEGPEENP